MTMKRALHLATAFQIAATVMAPDISARAREDVSTTADNANAQRLNAASKTLSLEDLLQSLSEQLDISFIFDSRLLKGVKAPPLSETDDPEMALRRHLEAENLSLHRVNDTTFAIARAAPGAISSPVASTFVTTAAPAPVDTIVVIATSLTGRAASGSPNLFVIDENTIETFAAVNPSEAIFDLPQMLATLSSANSSFRGAAAGLNLADLRGFGSQRTQALFNGRRRTFATGGSQFVYGFDLNAVATPFVKRIEVSNQFSGARISPEALGGAINFVTKNDFDGFEAGFDAGISQRGDAAEMSVHVLAGAPILDDRGHIAVGVNHARENGLFGADRNITAIPFGVAPRESEDDPFEFLPGFGGSTNTQNGLLEGVFTEDGRFISSFETEIPRFLNGAGGLEPFTGGPNQRFNFSAPTQILIPINRTLGFLGASFDLTEDVRLFADVQAGAAETNSEISPFPLVRFEGDNLVTGNALLVDIDDPTVPDPVRSAITDAFGDDAETIAISRRLVEFGPRLNENERRYADATIGFEWGDIDDSGPSLSAHYRYGRNSLLSRTGIRLNRTALQDALDTTTCAQTEGCAPINLFEADGISRAAVENIRAPGPERIFRVQEHEIATRFQANLPRLLEGSRLSAGALFRRTRFEGRTTDRDANLFGSFSDTDFDDTQDVGEFDIGIDTPLNPKDFFAGDFSLSTHYRAIVSSRFDTAHNVEADLRWSPFDGMRLSIGAGIGERPPNITETVGISRTRNSFFIDPCAFGDPATVEGCSSAGPLGVPDGFTQTLLLTSGTAFGNPDLDLERTHSWRAGLSLEPTKLWHALPGDMRLAAVWSDYSIKDVISAQDANQTLVDCFASAALSAEDCGINPLTGAPLIERDPVTRQLIRNDVTLTNGGALEWRGVDLEAQYRIETSALAFADYIWMSGLHTYLDGYSNTLGDGTIIEEVGSAGFPRHRSLMSFGVNSGALELSTLITRRGSAQSSSLDIPEAQIPAVTTFDVAARFRIDNVGVATVRIENATDKAAPLIAFAGGFNTFPEFYDIVGRRFSVGFETTF